MPNPAETTADPPSPQANSGSLRKAALRGSAWTVVAIGCGQLLRLSSNVVLAKILYPGAFGLMGIVNGIMQGLNMFSDFAVATSVVQNPRGDERAFLDTAFSFQVLRGLIITAIAAACAWPIASFYSVDKPEAFEIRFLLPMASIAALIDGFHSTKILTARRHLQLGKITAIQLGSQVLSTIAMLAVAYFTRSVYALIVAGVAQRFFILLGSHFLLQGVNNRFRWDPAAAQELFRFGKWLFVSTILTFLGLQTDLLVFGKVFPLEQAGVYAISVSLAAVFPHFLGRLQIAVLIPLYSRALQRGQPLADVISQTKRPILILAAWASTCLIAGSSELIRWLYDAPYQQAGDLIPILAVSGWLTIVGTIYTNAIIAMGNSRELMLCNLVKFVSLVVLLAITLRFESMMIAVFCVPASETLKCVYSILLTRRLGARGHGLEFLLTTVVVGLGVGVYFGTHWLRDEGIHPAISILLACLTATIFFALPVYRSAMQLLKGRSA